MDPEFFDLHREVEIEPTEEQLTARFAAVQDICAKANADTVATLLRLAHGKSVPQEKREEFWAPFKEREATFPVLDADLLHGLMALECLRELIRAGATLGDLSAMLVRLAELVSWEPLRSEMLRPMVRDYITEHGRRSRAAPPAVPNPTTVWNKNVADIVTASFPSKLGQPVTDDKPDEAFGALASATDTALKGLSASQKAITEWAGAEVGRLSEELEILRWLLSGVRADGTAWSTLPPAQLAIDAGLELASRLAHVPGPSETEALLAQVIGFAQGDTEAPDTTIATASAGTKSSSQPPPEQLVDLVPVHSHRAGRTLASDQNTRKWSAVDLGRLAFWEAMAIKAWTTSRGGTA